MKLLLARHGETDYNRQRKFYGSADVSLDKHGRQQAQALAEKIAVMRPTLLVQTNLRRTQQTIRPVCAKFPTIPIITLPSFAEKGFGKWEGLDADEIEAQYPEEWNKWLRAPLTYTPPTIEPFVNFEERVHQGLQWLLQHLAEEDTVFIVAHLGTLRLIYQDIVDSSVNFYSLDFKAACFSLIELKDGKTRQVQFNQ
jgi:alpha-ribazole phosphatase